MKTLILGTSGSGKSTLAQTLGAQRSAPVLHLDAVHFLPGWKERPLEQEREMVTCFLDENPSWVMDGNYTKTCMARRLAEADQILVLYFGRFTCLYRVVRRWLQNRGRVAKKSWIWNLSAGCFGGAAAMPIVPSWPRSPRLTRISLCCCAASASWKHGGKRRKQMGYKLADLTQQPEQASLKTTSATERI